MKKPHNFFKFVTEHKEYTDIDDLKKHVRRSANPIVDVIYVSLSGVEFNLISVAFFEIFSRHDKNHALN